MILKEAKDNGGGDDGPKEQANPGDEDQQRVDVRRKVGSLLGVNGQWRLHGLFSSSFLRRKAAGRNSWPPTSRAGAQSEFLRPGKESSARRPADRKSTRLNSSHGYISYAVFCLKKKKIRSDPSDSLSTIVGRTNRLPHHCRHACSVHAHPFICCATYC